MTNRIAVSAIVLPVALAAILVPPPASAAPSPASAATTGTARIEPSPLPPPASAKVTTPTLHTASGQDNSTPTLASRPPDYPFLKDVKSTHPWTRLPGGIWYRDIYLGKGKQPSQGVAVYMNYRGYLEDGTEFANTFKKRLPLVFTYGKGEVMKSLETAIATLRGGGKRVVVIPAELAYGKHGYRPPEADAVPIPPDATLIFEVTLLWIREPEFEKLHIFK